MTRGDLRHVAWRSLAEAERVALIALGEAEGLVHEVVDYDCDGLREVLVSTEHLGAVVRPASGGGLAELHLWGTGNFVNTLTRREEAWFALLAGLSKMPSLIGQQVAGGEDDEVDDDLLDDEDSTPSAVGRALGPVELPQRPPTPALDRGLETMLDVDPSVRACFLDRFLSPQTTLRSLMRGQPSEQGDFVGALYGLVSAEVIDTGALQVVLARDGTVSDGELKRLVRLTKRYRFPADRPVVSVDYEIVNRYHEPIHTRFAIELTLNLDSSREATRFLQVPGRTRINLDDSGELADVDRLEYVMEDLGVQVVMTTPTSATVTWYPVKTPERRVEGIGSSYQGHCILFGWDLELWGQEKSLFSLEIEVHRGAPNTERVPAPELPEPTSQSSQSSRRGES